MTGIDGFNRYPVRHTQVLQACRGHL